MRNIFKKKKKSPVKELIDFKKNKNLTTKFDKKTAFKKRKISKLFDSFLDLSGSDLRWKGLLKRVLIIDAVILGILSLVIIFAGVTLGSFVSDVAVLLLLTWTALFALVFCASLLLTLVILDFQIYQRTQQIESVLPDFLQLTSANVSAGLPIDRALWLAVRPQFGVLAEEMQEIAKSNFTGDDLETSLLQFSGRYRSRMLKEAISLIIAGIKSGGELGDLLSRIAENIRETQLMQKEIAASVMTYVIFIGAATVVASPVLFALSRQMLVIITSLIGSLGSSDSGGAMETQGAANVVAKYDMYDFSGAELEVVVTDLSNVVVNSVN